MRGCDKDIVNTCTVDDYATKIQSSIIKVYEKSYPLKTASGVQNNPYWNSELANLRKSARKGWNHRLTAYKNAIKEYPKALRSKKTIVLEGFCVETTDYTEYCPRTMTKRSMLSNFRQELFPALIKRL
jgi:hypothetical protein